jgi:iron complex outermembrane recepter protein
MSMGQISGRLALLVLSGSLVSGSVLPLRAEPIASPDRQSAHESTASSPASEPLRLSEMDQPATTIGEWVAQVEAALVQIINVRAEATATGLQVILETDNGTLIVPETRAVGNALIADIENAAIAEEFSQAEPIAGIALVSVTRLPGDRVRVAITGTDAPPVAEISSVAEGLAFAVATGTVAAGEEEAIELVVTATRTEEELENVPRSVTVITREEIEAQSIISQDLAGLLGRLVPGMPPPTGSNRDLTIRGRSPLLLINGVPVTSNFSNGRAIRDLRSIAPDAIERIEVIRGASAIYGNGATGGVINIITRQAEEEGLEVTTEVEATAPLGELEGDGFGFLGSQSIAISEGAWDLLGSLSYRDEGVYYDTESNVIPFQARSPAEANTLQLLGSVGVDLASDQRFQVTATYNNEEFDPSYRSDPSVNSLESGTFSRALEGGQRYIGSDPPQGINASVNLRYTHDNLFGNSQLDAQAYYRYSEVDYEAFDYRPFDLPFIISFPENSEVWGGRLQLNTDISNSLNVLWGVDYSRESNVAIGFKYDPEEYDRTSARVLQVIDRFEAFPRYRVENLGLFAQTEWNASPEWIFSGGLRYERINADVNDYFDLFANTTFGGGSLNVDDVVFNVGAVYKPTENVSLYASFAQGFSIIPIPLVFGGATAGFDLDEDINLSSPQRVDNYEIGVRSNWGDLEASIAAFYSYSSLGQGFAELDGNEADKELIRVPQRNYGIEASVDWQISRTWQVGGTLTWQESESNIDDDDEFEPLTGVFAPPWKATAYIENETSPGWTNRLQLLYSGSSNRAFNAGVDRSPLEGYTLLDFTSTLQIGSGELSLGIENLLDSDYETVFNQSQAFSNAERFRGRGRSIRLGYRFTW